jgi:hypothetical protein
MKRLEVLNRIESSPICPLDTRLPVLIRIPLSESRHRVGILLQDLQS